MSYYPAMAYHMPSLESRLTPPTGLGGLTDILNTVSDGISKVFTAADTVVATDIAVGSSGGAWCSTYNPVAGCTPIKGICLPMTASALATFKDLQRAANRVLVPTGATPIGVDGRIGPGTVAQVAKAMQRAAPTDPAAKAVGKPADLVAGRAAAITTILNAWALVSGAPVVPDPASSIPSQPNASGGVTHPPASDIVNSAAGGGLFNWIPAEIKTPLGIAAFGFAGYALWKASKKGGGRRGRARGGRARRRGR